MHLLDEKRWYCHKDDMLFFPKENRWSDDKRTTHGPHDEFIDWTHVGTYKPPTSMTNTKIQAGKQFQQQGRNSISRMLRAGPIALISSFVTVSCFSFLPCNVRMAGCVGFVILLAGFRGMSGKQKLVGVGMFVLFFLLFLIIFVHLFPYPQMVGYSYC
jgi:hypothetical protein